MCADGLPHTRTHTSMDLNAQNMEALDVYLVHASRIALFARIEHEYE